MKDDIRALKLEPTVLQHAILNRRARYKRKLYHLRLKKRRQKQQMHQFVEKQNQIFYENKIHSKTNHYSFFYKPKKPLTLPAPHVTYGCELRK